MAYNSRLKNYIDFTYLIEHKKLDKEEDRLWGIKLKDLKSLPLKQLKAWCSLYLPKTNLQSDSVNIVQNINTITFILIFVVFLIGLSAGYGLINYSGQKPINVLHFLFIGVLLHLFTLLLNIVVMVKDKKTYSNFLIRISPSF